MKSESPLSLILSKSVDPHSAAKFFFFYRGDGDGGGENVFDIYSNFFMCHFFFLSKKEKNLNHRYYLVS